MGQEQSSLIDEATPPQTLKDRSIESVAKYVKDGKAKQIVVMVSSTSRSLQHEPQHNHQGRCLIQAGFIGRGWHQHLCWNS